MKQETKLKVEEFVERFGSDPDMEEVEKSLVQEHEELQEAEVLNTEEEEKEEEETNPSDFEENEEESEGEEVE